MSDLSSRFFAVWAPLSESANGIVAAAAVVLLLLSGCFAYHLTVFSLKYASPALKKGEAASPLSPALQQLFRNAARNRRSARFGAAFCGCSGGLLAACTLSVWLWGMLSEWLPAEGAMAIACVSAFLLTPILPVFLCYELPRHLCLSHADSFCLRLSGLFRFLCRLTLPVMIPAEWLTAGCLRLMGRSSHTPAKVPTEEEIMMLVDEGEEGGLIEGSTKDMIENIFDFSDRTVGEIMTHRRDMVALPCEALITEVAETAVSSGRSRLPVYGEDMDDIRGILHVKDLLPYLSAAPKEETIQPELIKPAVYVPESKHCGELFRDMTAKRYQMAIVVDEFGGTGGVVTMEDLIESIVGNIQDEYDDEDETVRQLDDRRFTVDGAASLEEISELTGLPLEDCGHDTIAGLMLDRMGHIPNRGEHPSIMIEGTRFTVQEADSRRIISILVVCPPGHCDKPANP